MSRGNTFTENSRILITAVGRTSFLKGGRIRKGTNREGGNWREKNAMPRTTASFSKSRVNFIVGPLDGGSAAIPLKRGEEKLTTIEGTVGTLRLRFMSDGHALQSL